MGKFQDILDQQQAKELAKNYENTQAREPASPYKEMHQIRGLTFLSEPVFLKDLRTQAYNYSWVWDNYLAFSHITTLSAHPKVGKSTLLGSLLKAMETESDFISQPTHYFPVLVVTEESEHHWVHRREKLGLNLPISVWCSPLTHKLSDKEWEEFVLIIKDYCDKNGIKVVVFDTISKFWSAKDENKAGDMDVAFLPLNILKMAGFAVLIVHHFRKSGGEYGMGARGSSVFGATPDCLIDFMRADEQHATYRKISAVGRFPDTPENIIIDFDGIRYFNIGSLYKINELEREDYIIRLTLQLIKEEGLDGVTIEDLRANWDDELLTLPTKRTLQMFMKKKTKEGIFILLGTRKIKGGEAFVYRPAQLESLPISDSGAFEPGDKEGSSRVVELELLPELDPKI